MKIYLDLLPQKKKQEIKRKKLFRSILSEEILFLFPVLVFIVILANIYYVLTVQRDMSIAAHSLEQSQDKYQQLSTYEEKFKKINEISQVLTKIQSGHLHWEKIFQELSNITPDGVTVSDFSTKNYKIFLLGTAKTRDELLDFKSKLESSACFKDINVPLSNLVVKDDVDFQMDFSINEDCLKKQQ